MAHELIKKGTKVKYYPITTNKSIFSEHEVISDCWEVCGETVVKISGKSGGVSINHLEAI